jgi:hypothetical protein
MATLWIPGPLPGLNELLDAAKGAGGRGMRYAKLKRGWTEAVWALANVARLRRFDGPVVLRFEWVERDRRRDPDNVAAGGRKLVLDGLVKAGVLAGDGWASVAGWSDAFSVEKRRAGVSVTISPALDREAARAEIEPGTETR